MITLKSRFHLIPILGFGELMGDLIAVWGTRVEVYVSVEGYGGICGLPSEPVVSL